MLGAEILAARLRNIMAKRAKGSTRHSQPLTDGTARSGFVRVSKG